MCIIKSPISLLICGATWALNKHHVCACKHHVCTCKYYVGLIKCPMGPLRHPKQVMNQFCISAAQTLAFYASTYCVPHDAPNASISAMGHTILFFFF